MQIIITILLVINICILLYFLFASLHDLKLTQEIIDTLDMMKEYIDTAIDENNMSYNILKAKVDKIYDIFHLDDSNKKSSATDNEEAEITHGEQKQDYK